MMFFNKRDTVNTSKLFDEKNFYKTFLNDLSKARGEIIIESPYITSSRMRIIIPYLQKSLKLGVKVTIITRDPAEHDENIKYQATDEILYCKSIGINIVLLQGNHHRKLAFIDRTILWEGSLNILSQCNSQEVMRRTENKTVALEMFNFLKLNTVI